MVHNLEDIFVTEGVPEFTFVKPPNYGEILVDIRRAGKPVIVEGQSGTGKTTTIKKALLEAYPNQAPKVLTPREPDDLAEIESISAKSGGKVFVIDDFHRLESEIKNRLANLAKMVAERENRENLPKLIIVGINNIGSDLIQMVPDIAKRIGIHQVVPGTEEEIKSIIQTGSENLGVEITGSDRIFNECRGDYWLTQRLCKSICLSADVHKTQSNLLTINWEPQEIFKSVVGSLAPNFDSPIRIFCRGTRFRPTNDPYFKLLRTISKQEKSSVDLNELANANPAVRGSINNIKDTRLSILINDKPDCSRLFYYDSQTKNFALEDPALFFYLKHLDWDALRDRCGFRENEKDYEFDIAISFAGENRELAEFIYDQLSVLDISVFYDKNFEDNYLGGPWSKHFKEVFVNKSRLVVVLLDKYHNDKIWPTFERDCFIPRVGDGEVIPVRLDNTSFVGIPDDLASIHFNLDGEISEEKDRITDEVVLRIATKLGDM